MLTIEQIVALLVTKFPGMRKDALQSMAGVIALQAEDETSAQTIVDHMTADKVQRYVQTYRSNIDREIQQSNQTLEQNLRNKYDFKEKEKTSPQQQQQQQQQTFGLTLEQLKAILAEQLAPISQRMDAYDAAKVGQTRRETYLTKLKDAKLSEAMVDMMSAQFDRMTFKDDAEFNAYLESCQPTLDKLAQQATDDKLRNDRAPGFNTANKDGVSSAVESYLKQQPSSLGGKAI